VGGHSRVQRCKVCPLSHAMRVHARVVPTHPGGACYSHLGLCSTGSRAHLHTSCASTCCSTPPVPLPFTQLPAVMAPRARAPRLLAAAAHADGCPDRGVSEVNGLLWPDYTKLVGVSGGTLASGANQLGGWL
jgi:hypothetical protein